MRELPSANTNGTIYADEKATWLAETVREARQ